VVRKTVRTENYLAAIREAVLGEPATASLLGRQASVEVNVVRNPGPIADTFNDIAGADVALQEGVVTFYIHEGSWNCLRRSIHGVPSIC